MLLIPYSASLISCNAGKEEPKAIVVDKDQIKKDIQAREDEFWYVYESWRKWRYLDIMRTMLSSFFTTTGLPHFVSETGHRWIFQNRSGLFRYWAIRCAFKTNGGWYFHRVTEIK